MLDRLYRDRMRKWKRAEATKGARIDSHSEPGTRGGVSADGGLYEFVPQEEAEEPEVAELEFAEA